MVGGGPRRGGFLGRVRDRDGGDCAAVCSCVPVEWAGVGGGGGGGGIGLIWGGGMWVDLRGGVWVDLGGYCGGWEWMVTGG